MAHLNDRLDTLLGAEVATPMEEEFGFRTAEDLLRHYPHRYLEQGTELGEKNPDDGEHITIVATVESAALRPFKKRPGQFLAVVLSSDGQRIDATFFSPHKVKHVMLPGKKGMFSGKVKYYGTRWNLTHPSYIFLGADSEDGGVVAPGKIRGSGDLAGLARGSVGADGLVDMSVFDRSLVPIYHASKEIESWTFMRSIRRVLDLLDPVVDPLSEPLRRSRGLVDLDSALRLIHFPDVDSDREVARTRLKFDEALSVQLVLAQRRHHVSGRTAPTCPQREDGIAAEFERRLPFDLTVGQMVVAGEISEDLQRGNPMSRLLQGEVGSGKTVVALRAMLQVIDAGYQCALLAPTEVLAAQHLRSITTMLGELATAGELGAPDNATRVALLTGSMKVAAKREALLAAVGGGAGILIGTHALLQDRVEFLDLGMVVVDEQHRFGVEQRDRLRSRTRTGLSAHLLVMTATPIPRTIAMSTLGDLETSTLRELPKGRSPIVTNVVAVSDKPAWVDRAWARIREEVHRGRQAYVVCSRIGDGEDKTSKSAAAATKAGKAGAPPPDTTSAVEMFEMLTAGPLSDVRVGLMHGRLTAEEKDAAMAEFNAGDIDVLVCTTVIEVGVDVPNATVMVISDADRFGVSQLHQLRGRIGRGGHQGLCIFLSKVASAGNTFKRLTDVAATNDGFELALLDMENRREGDVLGSAQSGTESNLRLLSLYSDADVIADAQIFARTIIAEDPLLEKHSGLASMMASAVRQDRIEFLDKS